jgi:hypothetical protein
MRLILVILLLFMLFGMLPVWPYSAAWGLGYYPSGLFGLLLLIVLFSALFGGRARNL